MVARGKQIRRKVYRHDSQRLDLPPGYKQRIEHLEGRHVLEYEVINRAFEPAVIKPIPPNRSWDDPTVTGNPSRNTTFNYIGHSITHA